MIHLNGHMICAIDTETTGLQAGYHEIVELAIIPVGNTLYPRTDVPPFDCLIRPQHPERVDPKALGKSNKTFVAALDHGLPPETVVELLESWIRTRLRLPEGKRIIPLGHNAQFDVGFLQDLLGFENFNFHFDSRTRCTLATANFLNDRADASGEQIPFAGSLGLDNVARRLGIEVDRSMRHEARYDALLALEVYRKLRVEPTV